MQILDHVTVKVTALELKVDRLDKDVLTLNTLAANVGRRRSDAFRLDDLNAAD